MAYVVAGALVVLGANQLVHVAHDLNTMVFGNAVAVPFQDVVVLLGVDAAVRLVHTLFQKEIVFSSFDRETAEAMGMRVRLWDGVLFFTIGLAIPVSARALGALPVFAFLTVPASAALLATGRLRPAFAVATGLGVLAAAGGYVVSWVRAGPDRRHDGDAGGAVRPPRRRAPARPPQLATRSDASDGVDRAPLLGYPRWRP